MTQGAMKMERIRENFEKQAFMGTLGARITHCEEGRVLVSCKVTPGLKQQHGYAHAGVMASIADSACGYAALTKLPAGSEIMSVEFKINLIRPCTADEIVAEATVIKSGKTLTFCEATVAGKDGSGPFATFSAIMFCFAPKAD